MPARHQPMSDYFNDQINQALAVQWHRLHIRWEPEVIEALGKAADLALAGLVQTTAQAADAAGALPLAARFLRQGLPGILNEQVEATKAVLVEMLVHEAPRAAEALTLSGFLGQAPDWDLARLGRRDLLARFAGGAPLEQSAAKNLAGFLPRAESLLADAASAGLPLPRLRERMDALCQGWRGQLATLARTVLYNAAGRLRDAVAASLG